MWENSRIKKKISGLYYTEYAVKGCNLDVLIKLLQRKGLALYNIKKSNNKSMTFCIKTVENEKFFAIIKEIWYNKENNIKKVCYRGRFYFVYKWLKCLGLAFGIVFFIVNAFVFDDFLLSVEYSGSGNIYQKEVGEFLEANGIKKFSRFSDLDLDKLEDRILAENGHFSFVDCKKYGNRLKINLILSEEKVKTINQDIKELKSDVDGEIESVKVYRGTAVVKEGDSVKKGSLLVDGYMQVKEQTVNVNVLAYVSVLINKTFTFSQSKEDDDSALSYAEQFLSEQQIVRESFIKEKIDEEYIYRITIVFRHIIVAGI